MSLFLVRWLGDFEIICLLQRTIERWYRNNLRQRFFLHPGYAATKIILLTAHGLAEKMFSTPKADRHGLRQKIGSLFLKKRQGRTYLSVGETVQSWILKIPSLTKEPFGNAVKSGCFFPSDMFLMKRALFQKHFSVKIILQTVAQCDIIRLRSVSVAQPDRATAS